MNKKIEVLSIIRNAKLNHDSHLLVFKSEEGFSGICPGQFLNIKVPDSPTTFLRRPFSFFEVDEANGTFSVLIKTVGDGTRKLVSMSRGDKLEIIYPLGNSFTLPQKDEKVLLVGGGAGIAPMFQLAHESNRAGANLDILLGARSAEDHVLLDKFSKFGSLFITTNDGSLGVPGFVTDHQLLKENKGFSRIYCCGPEPMMKAVAARAKVLGAECEVSLENTMACGFGVCLCCVTKTTEGNKCVCTEGPVFNISNLKWQI